MLIPIWIVMCVALIGVLYAIILAILANLSVILLTPERRNETICSAVGYSCFVIPLLIFQASTGPSWAGVGRSTGGGGPSSLTSQWSCWPQRDVMRRYAQLWATPALLYHCLYSRQVHGPAGRGGARPDGLARKNSDYCNFFLFLQRGTQTSVGICRP